MLEMCSLGTFSKGAVIFYYVYECLPSYMYAHLVQVWYPRSPEQGTRSPKTGVIDGCNLPCGCWDLNELGSSARAVSVLTSEPHFQHSFFFFFCLFVYLLLSFLFFKYFQTLHDFGNCNVILEVTVCSSSGKLLNGTR